MKIGEYEIIFGEKKIYKQVLKGKEMVYKYNKNKIKFYKIKEIFVWYNHKMSNLSDWNIEGQIGHFFYLSVWNKSGLA